MDEFALINMNGRVYDPLLGRMLSPDNFVQVSDFTQSYNRYSYARNNPLKYNDPTGETEANTQGGWGMIGWGDIFLSWSLDFQMSALQFQSDMSTWHNAAPPLFLQGGAPGNSFAGNTHMNNISQVDMASTVTFTIETGYRQKSWVEDADGNILYGPYYSDPYAEIVPEQNLNNFELMNPQFINLPEGGGPFVDFSTVVRQPGASRTINLRVDASGNPTPNANVRSASGLTPPNATRQYNVNFTSGVITLNNPTAIRDVGNESTKAFNDFFGGRLDKIDPNIVYFRWPGYPSYPSGNPGGWQYGMIINPYR